MNVFIAQLHKDALGVAHIIEKAKDLIINVLHTYAQCIKQEHWLMFIIEIYFTAKKAKINE